MYIYLRFALFGVLLFYAVYNLKRAQISFTPRWKTEITHMCIQLPLKFLADIFPGTPVVR